MIPKPGDGGDGEGFTNDYKALDLISKFDINDTKVCNNQTALYYTCEKCQNDDKEVIENMMARSQVFWKYVCTEVIDASYGHPGKVMQHKS